MFWKRPETSVHAQQLVQTNADWMTTACCFSHKGCFVNDGGMFSFSKLVLRMSSLTHKRSPLLVCALGRFLGRLASMPAMPNTGQP